MISMQRVLSKDQTYCNLEIDSKKRLLETIASLMQQASNGAMNSQTIYEALLERERLGSTAIGSGVALPHARLESLSKPVGLFIRLANGINFDAEDNQSVDLIFALIVPQEQNDDYLNIMSQLAKRFRNPELLKQLRRCEESDDLYHLLVDEKKQ